MRQVPSGACSSASGIELPPCNPGGGAVTFEWSSPGDFGGVAIVSYVVTRVFPGPALDVAVVAADARNFTFRAPLSGSMANFTVRATNAAGTGPPSTPVHVVTAAPTKASAPQLLDPGTSTGGSVCFNWTLPVDSGTQAYVCSLSWTSA